MGGEAAREPGTPVKAPSGSPVRPRALLSWSTGKDSAWALHVLRTRGDVEVVGLLTTVNTEFDRVAMHAVRCDLLDVQAQAVGLPLIRVPLPWPCSNAQYEEAFARTLSEAARDMGVTHVAFGDLFLEDVRAYRERQLAAAGLTPLFPLWGLPTDTLARQMVDSGLRAILTCIDPTRLSPAFAGRTFDERLLADLPAGVDPCGENGEFHTLAYAGLMFEAPLRVVVGEIVERDGFVFADVTCGRASEEEPSIFDADGALTRAFLLARRYCCGNRCRNCPYGWAAVSEVHES